MKKLFWVLLLLPMLAHAAPCPVTVGALTLTVTQPRTSGISPFLAFFDATTSTTTATLGGAGTVVQDVYFAWNFGDNGVSGGSATWANGASGQTLRNVATGPVAAHLYVLPTNATVDANSTVQVWAKVIDVSTHAVTIASCTVTATTLAPSGANGFPNTSTTCVFNSTVGTGCPAGAATVTTSSFSTALNSLGAGKRVIFKCGDTFTIAGGLSFGSTFNKSRIGAYGGCENTTTGRPVVNETSGGVNMLGFGVMADMVVSDIDFEETDGTRNSFLANSSGAAGGNAAQTQLVFYNLLCHQFDGCFQIASAYQSGAIATFMNGMNNIEGIFWNLAENNCISGSTALFCGQPAFDPTFYVHVEYNALIGNNFDGVGFNNATTWETVRISACRYCIISNNTIVDSASSGGANLKLHSGNTFLSSNPWLGEFTEYIEISDNRFGGTGGSNMVENNTQSTNPARDERMRFIIVERNFFDATGDAGKAGPMLLTSASNTTIRNNVFYVVPSFPATAPAFGVRSMQALSTQPNTVGVEVYNNTCYAQTAIGNCVAFQGGGSFAGATQNSFAQNNLFYNNGAAGTAVNDAGTGNTVNSNTPNANVPINPGMSNGTTHFSSIADFLPSANATGANSAVPNYFDAFQLSWTSVYQLGALSQGAP